MRSFYKDLLKMLKKNEYSTDQNIIENHCIDWRGKYKGQSFTPGKGMRNREEDLLA